MNIQTKPKQRLLGRVRVTQQEIVFVVFAVLFGAFSALLPGFLSTDNMLTLLQNVAVLGILGLAMAIVVLGRGIDISLIAALAVPPGLVLQMVQGGHSLIGSIVTALLFSIAFGLINGWLIAYAEVPSLFTTLATGLFLAGFGQAAPVLGRRRAMESRNGRVPATGPGLDSRRADTDRNVRHSLLRGGVLPSADEVGRLYLFDR